MEIELYCRACNDFTDHELANENENAEVWECKACGDTSYIIPK